MLALAAPEHDRDLDLRPLVQEPLDVAHLGLVVVLADFRSELDLLDVDLNLVLAGLLCLLLLLVAVLPVVPDLRHGRVVLRRHLDVIQSLSVRVRPRLFSRLDAELLPLFTDQTHPRDADRIVDPHLRLRATRGLERPSPWPQILILKLLLSSFGNEKTADMQRRVSL